VSATTTSGPKIPSSFRPRIPIEKDQPLELKRHCKPRSPLRSLVGYYEGMALEDPAGCRFVWTSWKKILQGIRKHHSISTATLFRAIKEARALHIISARHLHYRFKKRYMGVIVAPAEALLVREGGWSVYIGLTDNPAPALGKWKTSARGEVYWGSKRTILRMERERDENGLRMERERLENGLRMETSKSENENENENENEKPDQVPEQVVDTENVRPDLHPDFHPDSRSLDFINQLDSRDSRDFVDGRDGRDTENRGQEIDKGESETNRPSEFNSSNLIDESVSHKELKKTVREVLGSAWTTPDGKGTTYTLFKIELRDIAPALASTKVWLEFEYESELCDACLAVVKEIADEPFEGDKTRAFIMDAAWKRFVKATGARVPKSWIKVQKDYERACQPTRPENE
jgi:hypothetical protein